LQNCLSRLCHAEDPYLELNTYWRYAINEVALHSAKGGWLQGREAGKAMAQAAAEGARCQRQALRQRSRQQRRLSGTARLHARLL